MSALVILAGLAFCFGAILIPLKLADRLAVKGMRIRKAAPIIGYVLGVCGLILIVGSVEAKKSETQNRHANANEVVVAAQLCKELTFHGWTSWRACQRPSE